MLINHGISSEDNEQDSPVEARNIVFLLSALFLDLR